MNMTFSFSPPTSARKSSRSVLACALLGIGFCAVVAPVHAQTYDVSLDTSFLTQGDQYAVDLQLNQGNVADPTTAGSSVVNVTDFMFGSSAADTTSGSVINSSGATGDLSRGVTLDTSGGPAEFTQLFSNGGYNNSKVSFHLDPSQLSIPKPGDGSDTFVFDLYDSSTNTQVATSSLGSELFTLTRDSLGVYTPIAYSYAGTGGGAHMTQFSTPSATPELGTVTSLGLLMGLFGLGALRARSKEVKSKT